MWNKSKFNINVISARHKKIIFFSHISFSEYVRVCARFCRILSARNVSVNFLNFGKCQTPCQSTNVSLTAHCECVVSVVNGTTNQLGGFPCAHWNTETVCIKGVRCLAAVTDCVPFESNKLSLLTVCQFLIDSPIYDSLLYSTRKYLIPLSFLGNKYHSSVLISISSSILIYSHPLVFSNCNWKPIFTLST